MGAAPGTAARSQPSIVSFTDLKPGLYQIADPADVKVIPAPVELREDEHYWLETKNERTGQKNQRGEDIWRKVPVALHANTAGLTLQMAKIGGHVHTEIVELDRQRVRVVAKGCWLRPDGTLEVIERSKEYDLAVETTKAAIKELKRRGTDKPSQQQQQAQGVAIMKAGSDEAALALVGTLSHYQRLTVMEARLEVQPHREGLCRTKAANQVRRVFVMAAGGVLKRLPGKGDCVVNLRECILTRRLSSEEVEALSDALYGASKAAQAAAGPAAAASSPPAAGAGEPEEPEVPDADVIEGEVVEDGAGAGGEEDGQRTALDEAGEEPAPPEGPAAEQPRNGPPTREEAMATWADLWKRAQQALKDGKIAMLPPAVKSQGSIEQIVSACDNVRQILEEAGA